MTVPSPAGDPAIVFARAEGRGRIAASWDGELSIDPTTFARLHDDDSDAVTLLWPDTEASVTLHRGEGESVISTPEWTIRLADVVFARIADGSIPVERTVP